MTARGETTRRSGLAGNAYLLLTGATLFWAGNVIASRLAVGEVSPMALTTFRWAGVLLLLPFIARDALLRDWPVLRRRLPYVGLMGVCGFTLFNACFYIAAHYTSAVNIGILQGAIPGFVFLAAFMLRGTRPRPAQIAGMLTTIVGVVVLATKGDIAALAGLAFNLGDLLILGASLTYSVYTVLLPDRPPVSAVSFFSGLAVAAFLSSVPMLGAEIAMGAFRMPSATGWAVIAYCAVFPSVMSQIFFVRGVELIGPGRAGVFVNLIPVFASVLAVLLLGEAFYLFHAFALGLVLGGILIAERVRRR